MSSPIPMQEMNDVPGPQQFQEQPQPQAQPVPERVEEERPVSPRMAAGYFGPDEDRMDRAAADLDAAIQQIGDNPTVEQLFAAAEIQALISIAGELRSIREAGISQGDVL